MRVDTFNDTTEFSGRFTTIGEAQGDAWASIDDELLDSKDFPWLLTMNEMLETVISPLRKSPECTR